MEIELTLSATQITAAFTELPIDRQLEVMTVIQKQFLENMYQEAVQLRETRALLFNPPKPPPEDEPPF